jgi:adenylate cyclase
MRSDVVMLWGRRGRRLSGRALANSTRAALTIVAVLANLAGAAVVFAVGLLVLPNLPVDDPATVRLVDGVAGAAYLLLAVPLGLAVGFRYARPVREWLEEERAPTEAEQRRALRAPLVVLGIHAAFWWLAAVMMGLVNIVFSVELAVRTSVTVALGGLTTAAVAYLLSERILRPTAIRALGVGPPPKLAAPGVTVRFVLAWSLGTAVPVVGMVLIGIGALADEDASADELARTMVALGAVALLVGLLAVLVTARAVAGPVRSVGRALREVERGDFDVEVQVDDGSELGRLQAGVNRMVGGLREREELRDLFGRHVGEDVARAALDRGVELGGEVRDVAVLFVDVIGSTTLAADRPPKEVVELLNRFFAVVVEVVDRHGGWVNKFEGDAALAIFGAPTPLDDHEACALAAARELGERLCEEVPGLEAGIGVSAGEAVAGNVGTAERFEYTVIGDPVNEAARLSELAKDVEGRVVASARLLERAGEEHGHWREADEVTLRGRREATPIAVPA